ncbi:hypothetical protein J6X04_00165 [Candidatus Saccharibacteria bacterium]|nr:hypothetical protein [Candidatus Saccharibacteria bacterium]
MKKNKSVRFIVIALVLVAIAIFFWMLINGKETRISSEKENVPVSVLYCTSGNIEGAFFTSETVNTTKNEIKVMFEDDKLNNIFYAYNGTYRSTEVAREDETRLHAKYNLYMGDNNISQESLSPAYSVVNSKLHLTLYVDDYDKINSVTSVFFFINEDKIEDYEKYSIDEMKTFYKNKGFKCEINE